MFYCYGGSKQFWRRSSLVDLGGFEASFAACGDLDVLCRLNPGRRQCGAGAAVLEGFFQNQDGISRATDVSLREQGEIFAKARAETPLDMMYAIDPDDPESVAAAWTTLGNMAFDVRVPWHPDASRDVPFAVECYERALAVVPDHLAANHNRYVALAATGRADEAERDLATLTAARSALVRGQGFALERPPVVQSCGTTAEPTAISTSVAATTVKAWNTSWNPNTRGHGFGQRVANAIAPIV